MNKYAQSALEAVKLFTLQSCPSPREAWEEATKQIFGENTDAQNKGCPRDAFLGLCEEGLIKGIPRGRYCNSIKNKKYALSALNYLRQDPSLSRQPANLWEIVMDGEQKKHNSQMDVVLALWNSGLISSVETEVDK